MATSNLTLEMIVEPKLRHTQFARFRWPTYSFLDRLSNVRFSLFRSFQYEIWHSEWRRRRIKIVHFGLCALGTVRMSNETKKKKWNENWRRRENISGMTMKENSPLYWNSLCTNQIYTMYKLYTLSCAKRSKKKSGVMFKTATSLPIFVLVIHNTFAVAFVRM